MLFAKYTLARLALFVGCYLVIWLAAFWFISFDEVNALSTAIVALLISSFIAYRYLGSLRDRFAEQVSERADRLKAAYEAKRAAEDDIDVPAPPRPGASGDADEVS